MEAGPVQWGRNFFRGIRNIFREMALKDPIPEGESDGSFRETLLKGATEQVWTTGALRTSQRVRPVQYARHNPAFSSGKSAGMGTSRESGIIRSQPLPYQPAQSPEILPSGDEVTEIGGFLGEAAEVSVRRTPDKSSSLFRSFEAPAMSFDYRA